MTSKLRLGLIGCGAWGSHHARVIAASPTAELAGIAEYSEANRNQAKANHPAVPVYADYQELLKRPDIDAVDIVLPSFLHHEAGRAALEAGKHVMLEKPLALEVAQCDDLIATAKARGLVLAVGHELRFSPLWGTVKRMLDEGAVGDPKYLLIELWRNPYRQGSEGWRYDRKRVGNWILEEPIHFFDLARWYFEKWGAPVSVYARANSRSDDRPDLQDNFSSIVDFPGGRYAIIGQTLAAFEHHQVVKITGSTGSIWANWSGAMDRTFHPVSSLKHFDGEKVRDVPMAGESGEVYELEHEIEGFVQAIQKKGTSALASGEDGRWSVQLCLKAQESVDSGSVVMF